MFAPSTGTKRLGVVKRFNRTFREKYVKFSKMTKKMKHTVFFKDAIPHIFCMNASLMTTHLSKNS